MLYPIDARGVALLRPSLIGGIQFRWIDIGNGTSDTFPGIENRFSEASAPGLTDQDALAAARAQPALARLGDGYALFRVGDAVASRNIHAAIYDSLRLMKDL